MYTPLLRIIFIIGSIGMAIFFYSKSDFTNMALVLFSAILFIYGYFKYGTVYVAFQELKKGNNDKAEKLISKIKNPKILNKGQKSYYHFIQGVMASNREDWEKSYSEFTQALNIGLRTKNDTSIVLLHLANIEFERKNFDQANAFIKKVRAFDLKPLIESETDKLENEISVAQQSE